MQQKSKLEAPQMLSEFVSKILTLALPNQLEVGGLTYVDKHLTPVMPPVSDLVEVSTLQGLVDLYNGDLGTVKTKGDVLIHITSPTTVEIVSRLADDWARREVWARATYPTKIEGFPFGQWLNIENFIIMCQSRIQRVMLQKDDGTMAQDLDYVLKIASAISAESIETSEDDGISQKVATRRGVVLKDQTNLKSRVTLAPYRTFAEVDQVPSTFVFRARKAGDEQMNLALFEADGGRWRLAAVANIAAWLGGGKFGDAPIIS
jgi:hypothetical protein